MQKMDLPVDVNCQAHYRILYWQDVFSFFSLFLFQINVTFGPKLIKGNRDQVVYCAKPNKTLSQLRVVCMLSELACHDTQSEHSTHSVHFSHPELCKLSKNMNYRGREGKRHRDIERKTTADREERNGGRRGGGARVVGGLHSVYFSLRVPQTTNTLQWNKQKHFRSFQLFFSFFSLPD